MKFNLSYEKSFANGLIFLIDLTKVLGGILSFLGYLVCVEGLKVQ